MSRLPKLLILLGLLGAGLVLASASATAAPPRFQGYVRGAVTGPGHSFFVGDGLGLVFRDRSHAGTRYTACWSGPHADIKCWHRRTGARGRANRIPTVAPHHVGSYIVRWKVNHRVVAHWRFYNHIGD